jgi:hypothetical protein
MFSIHGLHVLASCWVRGVKEEANRRFIINHKWSGLEDQGVSIGSTKKQIETSNTQECIACYNRQTMRQDGVEQGKGMEKEDRQIQGAA